MTIFLIWSKFLYHFGTDRKRVTVESPPFPVKATFSLNFKYCKNDSIDNSLPGQSAPLIGHRDNAWVSATNNESFILLSERLRNMEEKSWHSSMNDSSSTTSEQTLLGTSRITNYGYFSKKGKFHPWNSQENTRNSPLKDRKSLQIGNRNNNLNLICFWLNW